MLDHKGKPAMKNLPWVYVTALVLTLVSIPTGAQELFHTKGLYDIGVLPDLIYNDAAVVGEAELEGAEAESCGEFEAATRALKLDIYYPRRKTTSVAWDLPAKSPVLVLFHGGGFLGGTKDELGDESSSTMAEYAMDFASRGYITASVEYRRLFLDRPPMPEGEQVLVREGEGDMSDFLRKNMDHALIQADYAPFLCDVFGCTGRCPSECFRNHWYATIESACRDASSAVDWLRCHAQEELDSMLETEGDGEGAAARLEVDFDRMVLGGDSAGAVVSLFMGYGPSFIRQDVAAVWSDSGGVGNYELSPEFTDLVSSANPTEVPALIATHGELDQSLPMCSIVNICRQLMSQGRVARLVTLPGARHEHRSNATIGCTSLLDYRNEPWPDSREGEGELCEDTLGPSPRTLEEELSQFLYVHLDLANLASESPASAGGSKLFSIAAGHNQQSLSFDGRGNLNVPGTVAENAGSIDLADDDEAPEFLLYPPALTVPLLRADHDGNLYLAGHIYERVSICTLNEVPAPAFRIDNTDGDTVALINAATFTDNHLGTVAAGSILLSGIANIGQDAICIPEGVCEGEDCGMDPAVCEAFSTPCDSTCGFPPACRIPPISSGIDFLCSVVPEEGECPEGE